nr:adenine DNA methylase [Pseudoalteromonas sp. MMG010]
MLAGCSTISFNNLFNDYASEVAPIRSAIKNNNLNKAQQLISKRAHGHANYLLNLLEQARLADLNNDSQQAKALYERIYQQVQLDNQSAKLQLSTAVEQSNALLTNDSSIAYTPPRYEMSMLHSYKALNYIYDNNLEAALVEIRRANQVQKKALQDNQTQINETQTLAQSHYPAMDELIGNIKNGFQNAFTYYLSALLYQANKQYDDAYIDYKKALEIMPNNQFIQQDLQRLAKRQNFDIDFPVDQQSAKQISELPPEQGEVIIILEQGLVPSQVEFKIRLPINTSSGDARFYSLALPAYNDMPYSTTLNNLMIDQQPLQFSPLVNIESLAAKTLKDEMPSKLSRQLLRLYSKEKLREEIARSAGNVGNIIANIYNLASEQADTRSWNTLPNKISVARYPLTPGIHSLNIINQSKINFSVSKQGLTLIYLTSINHYFNYHVVKL